MSAIFAIQQIAHSLAPGGVRALIGFERIGAFLAGRFFFAAVRTPVGEAGLSGFEFKFFAAYYAGFDRICHTETISMGLRGFSRARIEYGLLIEKILPIQSIPLRRSEPCIADDSA